MTDGGAKRETSEGTSESNCHIVYTKGKREELYVAKA